MKMEKKSFMITHVVPVANNKRINGTVTFQFLTKRELKLQNP